MVPGPGKNSTDREIIGTKMLIKVGSLNLTFYPTFDKKISI